MSPSREHQGGNAVLLILIGVALFAALAYTFMKGSKQGQGNMSTQQAKIVAQNIRSYAMDIEQGINKLVRRGCSQDQLSFAGSVNRTGAFYNNTWAPSDKSCHVFDPAGAGIADNAVSTGNGTNTWHFGQNNRLVTQASPLQTVYGIMAMMTNVSDNVCTELNKQAGNGWVHIPTKSSGNWNFKRYNPSVGMGIISGPGYTTCTDITYAGPPSGTYCGVSEGCINDTVDSDAPSNMYFRFVYTTP